MLHIKDPSHIVRKEHALHMGPEEPSNVKKKFQKFRFSQSIGNCKNSKNVSIKIGSRKLFVNALIAEIWVILQEIKLNV